MATKTGANNSSLPLSRLQSSALGEWANGPRAVAERSLSLRAAPGAGGRRDCGAAAPPVLADSEGSVLAGGCDKAPKRKEIGRDSPCRLQLPEARTDRGTKVEGRSSGYSEWRWSQLQVRSEPPRETMPRPCTRLTPDYRTQRSLVVARLEKSDWVPTTHPTSILENPGGRLSLAQRALLTSWVNFARHGG